MLHNYHPVGYLGRTSADPRPGTPKDACGIGGDIFGSGRKILYISLKTTEKIKNAKNGLKPWLFLGIFVAKLFFFVGGDHGCLGSCLVLRLVIPCYIIYPSVRHSWYPIDPANPMGISGLEGQLLFNGEFQKRIFLNKFLVGICTTGTIRFFFMKVLFF